ncbi:site-specific integrase [Quisquiliibacterium transsilvanicum]|uniref:Integrase n=1 Tax=Quisquiliibacterium transsilvanicum TaxID=1549638 RepID=A0A7W8M7U7_9BURK|nr:integrase family protein [Quisquiliibacterium transsilvanicum]MBB5270329.1 integrase [Quisquiliibacterium transsilvanicum]
MKFTDPAVMAALKAAKASNRTEWHHEPRGRGAGALSLKASAQGRGHWYFRYSLDRKHQYVPIGAYGKEAPEIPLRAARDECNRLDALRATVPGGDLRGHLMVKEATEEREHRAEVQAVVEAPRHTLQALMDAYAVALESQGKKDSAQDVRGMVRLHLTEQFQDYAKAPAAEFTRKQATEVLRKLVEAGKGRTAGKLRAYLRAAFALALRAESDASASSAMIGFDMETNPVAGTVALTQFNRVKERALSDGELRALWKRLEATDTPSSLAIRIALLLGGQRFTQLLRAKVADFDQEAGTLTLYDPKGRRKVPRAHVLPVGKAAAETIHKQIASASILETGLMFPARGGVPMTVRTVSKFLQDVRAAMLDKKEAQDFDLADLRRTCETQLAKLGISKDLRAQVQSHGLGGVQARHYDRYDYMDEKSAALTAWASWLTGTDARNVVPIGQKRKARAKAAA